MLGLTRCIPVVGPILSLVLTPGAEAAGVVLAGDRLGPYRSSFFWPGVATYVTTTVLMVVSVIPAAGLVGLSGAAAAFFLLAGTNPAFAYVGIALLAGSLSMAVLYGVGGAFTAFLPPLMATLAYHFSSRPKSADDNGSGLPRLLPRGGGLPLPLPRLRPDPDEDADEDDNEDDERTPVSAPRGT
jgi:hypothetical protein